MTQREGQRRQTRDAILAEAAAQFEQRGYLGASLRNIADALGLTVGALFFHFKSKEALATEIIQSFYEHWDLVATKAQESEASSLRIIAALAEEVATAYRDDVQVAAAVRLIRDGSVVSPQLPDPYVGWMTAAAGIVRRGQAQGEIRADLDPQVVAYQLVCVFFGNQHISKDLTDRADLVERLRDAWRIFFPALVAPGVELDWLTT